MTAAATPTATPDVGAVRGVVWYDRNGDGARDMGEPGLLGVTIRLYSADAEVGQVLTTGLGAYQFEQLSPGWYRVVETQPSWLRFSSTLSEQLVQISAGAEAVVDFGDWNGRSTWLPLIVR
jgi:hypothetical protein